ncbi:transcription factor SPEECHLESS [Senna tora]|uniref:Transcription factor SPEECHLESS n=1 Tax=Senna tora TaxID=362788 RepID=A0A834TXQ6_9FABA|nr:transcription factor SPEECHLESS [Senna tora]
MDTLDDFSPTSFPALHVLSPKAATASEESSRLDQSQTTHHRPLQTYLPRSNKRQKLSDPEEPSPDHDDGLPKMSHITVERNRRKQMNHHLSVLRSLMPCFYVKRGDQASIIGGVVDYISELQQLLQSLEAKKQRKVYTEVLSPRGLVSPKPPVSPRLSLPISPRTPSSGPARLIMSSSSPTSSANSCSINDNINELVANSKSHIADVEVKFSGPHVLLKTISPPIPGQALKIISALEDLALEILHVSITTADETMLNSFTIKRRLKQKVRKQRIGLGRGHPDCVFGLSAQPADWQVVLPGIYAVDEEDLWRDPTGCCLQCAGVVSSVCDFKYGWVFIRSLHLLCGQASLNISMSASSLHCEDLQVRSKVGTRTLELQWVVWGEMKMGEASN